MSDNVFSGFSGMEENVNPVEKQDEKNINPVKKQNEKNDPKKKKKKRTATSYMIEFFIKIIVTALVVCGLCFFVVGVYVNHNNSSYPMIKDGDLCITYKLAKLNKGDVIAYEQDGKTRFGRIVAIPGDTIDANDIGLTVNGYGAYEDAVYPTTTEGASITLPYTVPQGTFFVLNDYRDDITDSRTYGGIPETATKGKIVLLLRLRGF